MLRPISDLRFVPRADILIGSRRPRLPQKDSRAAWGLVRRESVHPNFRFFQAAGISKTNSPGFSKGS
jgi:hypothetical protein